MGVIDTVKESSLDDNGSTYVGDSQDEAVVERKEDRLFTSDFVFSTLANFVNGFNMQMLIVTLPVYVIYLGGNKVDAGMVSGALAFTALLLRPFVGWLTDAWRRRPLVLIGTSCYGLASIIYLMGSIPFLLLGRVVNGFGLCCYTTAANAYVADVAPFSRRGEAMGLFAAAQALGFIIGPVVGFLLIAKFGFQYLFYLSGGIAFIALVFSFFTRERRETCEIKQYPWTPRTGIVAIESLPVAWIALCMGLSFGAIATFIALFAQPKGLQNPGFYFMIQAVALLLSRIFAGHLADHLGRAAVILPGIIMMTLSLLILPLADNVPCFLISATLMGFGFGIAQPATMALLIDQVRPERRGLAISTYFTGYDIGISVGTMLMGVVSQYWGFNVMWLLVATCTLLGLVGLFANHQHIRSIVK